MARLCAETEMLTNQLPKNANAMTERHRVPSAPIASSPVTRIARQTSSAARLNAAAPTASTQPTKQRAQTVHPAEQGFVRKANASCLARPHFRPGSSTALALRHYPATFARLMILAAQHNVLLQLGLTRAGTWQVGLPAVSQASCLNCQKELPAKTQTTIGRRATTTAAAS